jgi:hypothetical protein
MAGGPEWESQWLRDYEDRKDWDIKAAEAHERYYQNLKAIYMDPQPPREDDEITKLVAQYGDQNYAGVSGYTSSEISE